ncbi:MAG: class I SAM-dependent methyltransferase [Bacteroidetes bacterium]|nr:MAG: class I SAM-dependent methyltransferase [Bacteroidota bacterium]
MYHKIETCPLCTNTISKPFYLVKDHAISKESFSIVKCSNCSFVYTNPRPTRQDTPRYYESENYVSHTPRSRIFTDKIYYLTRYFMLRRKLNWIHKLLGSRGRVLDYGCGTGSFVSLLQKRKWDAWGVEPNDQARSIANDNGTAFVFESLEELPWDQCEVITLWHVLEHVPDLKHTMNELLYRLTKNGLLFIAVPNYVSYDAQYYKEYWAGFDVPRHLSHFTPESMKLLVKKHKLHLLKIIPLKFDAFYISLLSEKYRNGSTINAFLQAIHSNHLAKKNHLNYSSLVYVIRK